jgi:hypothetical protein
MARFKASKADLTLYALTSPIKVVLADKNQYTKNLTKSLQQFRLMIVS